MIRTTVYDNIKTLTTEEISELVDSTDKIAFSMSGVRELSEEELAILKAESSQPALDTKESLDQEIKELEKKLSDKQVKRLML